MSADILTNIQNDIHAFSKGQKKIAAYILSNYDKAAFMTASRLGKTVEVSESTVVRFAVELGFDGYPSMQRALQDLESRGLLQAQRTAGRTVTANDTVLQALRRKRAATLARDFLQQMQLKFPELLLSHHCNNRHAELRFLLNLLETPLQNLHTRIAHNSRFP